jgi:hypothetical protein
MRMIRERFESVDFEDAKKDVIPFITNRDALNGWKRESFIKISERIRTI